LVTYQNYRKMHGQKNIKSKWSLRFRFTDQNFVCVYMHCLLFIIKFFAMVIYIEQYKSQSFSWYIFSSTLVLPAPSCIQILPAAPRSQKPASFTAHTRNSTSICFVLDPTLCPETHCLASPQSMCHGSTSN